MSQTYVNRFHPKRWTPLTWLAILLWAWEALSLNYPPSASYRVDSVTGEFSDPIHYESLSEIPFPVGWPLHYVTPSNISTPAPAWLVGTPLPPPAPSKVSLFAMVANFVLIVIAISALVHILQKYKYQYSLLFVLLLMPVIPLYFALGRLVVFLAGYNAVEWYYIAVYFSPVAVALAARYSIYPRFRWARFRLNCKSDQRSCDDYDNPDDAIAAALRLDMSGDWTASILLYRDVAKRWPEHAAYINRCIDQITQKQSLAQT